MISNLNWSVAQMRKDLQLSFLIYFRFFKDFHEEMKVTLLPIKILINLSKFKSIILYKKFSKKLKVSIDFSFRILVNLIASLPPPQYA